MSIRRDGVRRQLWNTRHRLRTSVRKRSWRDGV